ncbi:MAG: T9SS type A sorting domain-containing protein [Bacteroidales bacterium]|nr:T9SS type A sorting domain-containing protein [Bacteroidales bacterium]
MIKRISILMMAMLPAMLWAQFAPAAGLPGSTAMHADSSAFVAWATGCTVERGLQRIDKPSLGVANFGEEALALGKPGGTMDVVSLGDGGVATLTFDSPICNGEGPDFAVFENGFANAQHPDEYFLEIAFVEVSSDGENFFRFPAVSNVPFETQLNGSGTIVPTLIHNFASKYEAFYGTPFDLDEVEDNELLNKNRITHVRLVDVVGSIDPEYATYDSEGHIVNDPFPTPFGSSGFDLDAVGVIHDLAHNDVSEHEKEVVALYPNPVKDQLNVKAENLQLVEVFNVVGQQVMTSKENVIDFGLLMQGVYFVRVSCGEGVITKRIVKQ